MFCDIINEYSLLCTSFSKILDSNENHKFEVPQRAVFTPEDVKKWEQSNAYQDIIGFLTAMNTAVKGKKLSVECAVSPVTVGLLNMLDTISHWIDDIPPVDQPQRYGNTAFRDFYAKLKENGEQVWKEALQRTFMQCPPKKTVTLEIISPEMFSNEKIVNENADEYMFLACIKFILSVKTGPFAEHSNQLWNISGVQSWSKINQGLIKMYKAEVLHKFPVVQHMLFGSILSISPAKEITYHPPGTEISSMRNPSMSSATGGQGFMPPRASAVASQGRVSMTDRMPVHISQMSKMPQDLPFNDISSVMPPVSKTPQGLSTVDKVSSNMLTTSKTSLPCAEERHPAMSPLNSLPPDIFPKATKHTQ
nr:serine/threonine-protein phosphatase 2A activator-like [Cherax quadricarinatus]